MRNPPTHSFHRMVDDDFNDVEPGHEGELLVRSPLVTQGYFNNPQATKDAFHGDWFCTGDIGILRNGKFYIVDRKKVRFSISSTPCPAREALTQICPGTP